MPSRIPIVDLFAGPGGLGEGFSSVLDDDGNQVFKIAVSIEKDPIASQTLKLRAAFRLLKSLGSVDRYYSYIRGEISEDTLLEDLFAKEAFTEASREAHCAELGKTTRAKIDAWIRYSVQDTTNWVLIGGPPCQAYSLAGRSRRTNDENFEIDEKHLLYKEYLHVIKEFAPPVFVMENVKGLLSSQHDGSGIFSRILGDLSHPRQGLEYEIRSFVHPADQVLSATDFVIRSELYGVPQKRHRVILLGVRRDRRDFGSHILLQPSPRLATVNEFLKQLPKLRSSVSKSVDSQEAWYAAISETPHLLRGWKHESKAEIADRMREALRAAVKSRPTGKPFVRTRSTSSHRELAPALKWVLDNELGGVCQHQSRGHMAADLRRYLFAACYAQEIGTAPRLRDFPDHLLPNHDNATSETVPFEDRFRVQTRDNPSSTVVSHIAKDGHYYIHYDPSQCRSFTVREAARLQTFPDNYFFEGNRTQQYTQVGNAVPPYLARQLGRSVAALMGVEVSNG